ncbi:hypothetical protein GGH12_000241 [Coemansia sp. RSA 1822]|nr:hypothetical protein GGH12_000241 [Coemansia sp. RSA 1822]
MNAIAVNAPKAQQQGTTTIVETITGIAPATADPESLMLAIAAKIANEAQATETVTVFTTINDNDDDDDDDDDDDEHTRHHKSRSSKSSSRHKGDSSTRRGDDDDDDEEPDMGDFDLIVMSSSSSTSQSGFTPCPSYMTFDSVTVTFIDASQCAISDDDSSDVLASPEPTPDSELGGLDNECWMVVTRGSQTLTYSNADACLANSMLPGSMSESEPNSELGGLDDSDFGSSSESEFSSRTIVARPVMGSLGYNIYESTGEALICSASTS